MGTRSLQSKIAEDDGDGDQSDERTESSRNQYNRDRSARTASRRSSRTAKRIDLGISGRRQRRWEW
jgi:hypothetical protein